MKKNVFFIVILGLIPMFVMGQDDMYIYKQSDVDKKTTPIKEQSVKEQSVYYSGINKSEDEYNRRGKFRSSYQIIGKDSLGNDIVEYIKVGGQGNTQVVDTIYSGYTRYSDCNDDDFAYSRRMSRFDGYYGNYYDPWFAGAFYDPFYYRVRWGWHSSFYGGWYDPWYGSYYTGWYSPYYSYYGWGGMYPYYGYYYGRPFYRSIYVYKGHTGTANHWGNSRVFNKSTRSYSNNRSSLDNNNRNYNSRFGGHRGNFSNSRSNNSTISRPSQPSRSTFSGGSFGGANRGSFSGGSNNGSTRATFGGAKFGGHR